MDNNIICPCNKEVLIKQKYGITTYIHLVDNSSCKFLNRYNQSFIISKKLSDISISNNNIRQMFALKNNVNSILDFIIHKLSENDYNELENNFKEYQKIIESLQDELYKYFGSVLFKNLKHLNIKYSINYRPGIVPSESMLDLSQQTLKSNIEKISDQINSQKVYKKYYKKYFNKRNDK